MLWHCEKCGLLKDKPIETDGPVHHECRARPSISERVRNYAQAAATHALTGKTARDQTIAVRLAICQACEKYANGWCNACGCACNKSRNGYRNKLAMAEQRCPLNKWTEEPTDGE